MYLPFLRSKQYELILLRENADLIAHHSIIPIIEPVRHQFAGLKRALSTLQSAGAEVVVIANPTVGAFADDCAPILDFLWEQQGEHSKLSVALAVSGATSEADMSILGEWERTAVFHLGQVENGGVLKSLQENTSCAYHVFVEEQCGKLYRRKFNEVAANKVLLRDGFIQRRNADYEEHEHFSDLHATYPDERMSGFGDYLIVGSPYVEGGGPAYAVVIHITYIDEEDDMHICHFKSDRTDSPVNPGGKFGEALAALIQALDEKRYPIQETRAIAEFRQLHERGHYPGLGYLKKLCMQHHLEVMAAYLDRG